MQEPETFKTFFDGFMMKLPNFDQAWGAPVYVGDLKATISVPSDKAITWVQGPSTTMVVEEIPTTIQDAVKKLTEIAERVEADIAYFKNFEYQGMAMNRFSFLKRDILKIAEDLNTVCTTTSVSP